ncbi:MAG TPA: Gfo/Idh/MocA family oxidoreductase [Gemmataceae bacterium]|jgi:predicted dehydrogenase
MSESEQATYGVAEVADAKRIPAPILPYQPQNPRAYHPAIALIGCGGISEQHLRAYQKAGYRVVALCDRHLERADRRRAQFSPHADLYTDYRRVLDRPDIDVVDLTPHPHDRLLLIEDALRAGKHVLSQKPFVLDLDDGDRLVELARRQGVTLAVNQNGRWAPHFSYMRQAVQHGMVGDVIAVHLSVHWNHHWIVGTSFENIRHLILYDFGIHWFDMVHCLMGKRAPRRVYARATRSAGQTARPPLLAQAIIEYDDAQASLVFDADTKLGPLDESVVIGTKGTIRSSGVDLQQQTLTLTTEAGEAVPKLEGKWFPDGFHGAMAELLCAIEDRREPVNNARDNLASLALCFAALASVDRRHPVEVGTARRMQP